MKGRQTCGQQLESSRSRRPRNVVVPCPEEKRMEEDEDGERRMEDED